MRKMLLFVLCSVFVLGNTVTLSDEEKKTITSAGGDPERCGKYVVSDSFTGKEEIAIVCRPANDTIFNPNKEKEKK